MLTCEPHGFTICYVNLWLWWLLPLPQVVVGTIGNILNVVILCRRRMRKFSTTVYLVSIAVADILTLWTGVFPDILDEVFGFAIRSYSVVFCKSLRFLSYCAGGFSVWLVVLMTLERMILTVSPIVARTSLSVKNAVVVASLAFVVFVLFSGHHLFGLDIRTLAIPMEDGNLTAIVNISICLPRVDMWTFYTQTWPLVVIFSLVIVPFTIIVVGNGAILLTLLMQKRRLRKVNPAGNSSAMSAYNNRKSSTTTLLLICAMFITTTCPYAINEFVSAHIPSSDPYTQAQKDLVTTLVFILLNCNFMFNFVLYFVSGTLFKQEWKALLGEINARIGKVVGKSATNTRGATLTTEDGSLQTRQTASTLMDGDNKTGAVLSK